MNVTSCLVSDVVSGAGSPDLPESRPPAVSERPLRNVIDVNLQIFYLECPPARGGYACGQCCIRVPLRGSVSRSEAIVASVIIWRAM